MTLFKVIKERLFMSDEQYMRKHGVKVGKHCSISTRMIPSEGYLLEIGNYVRIAANTSFYSHGGIWALRHLMNDPNLDIFGKIIIGDYTSIGSNVMVMPGVTIGKGCIVGGGSVVTKSVPDGCMVAGNPARFIGYTEDFYKRLKNGLDFACKQMCIEEKEYLIKNAPDEKFIHKPYIKLPEEIL